MLLIPLLNNTNRNWEWCRCEAISTSTHKSQSMLFVKNLPLPARTGVYRKCEADAFVAFDMNCRDENIPNAVWQITSKWRLLLDLCSNQIPCELPASLAQHTVYAHSPPAFPKDDFRWHISVQNAKSLIFRIFIVHKHLLSS